MKLKLRPAFKSDEMVRIRPFEKIEQTLDENGTLEGLPFMPEMKIFCGESHRVYKKANFTCIEGTKIRGLNQVVLLEGIRCNGEYHDGCQKSCLIFWKEAWLDKSKSGMDNDGGEKFNHTKDQILLFKKNNSNDRYFCQSTQLKSASYKLGIANMWSLLYKEIFYGNQKLEVLIRNICATFFYKFLNRSFFNSCKILVGHGLKTPEVSLHLQPGNEVEVISREKIIKTLNKHGNNRGLGFGPEMFAYCGNRYKVFKRLDRMINEENGKMISLKNTVLLGDVVCEGMCKLGCPRHMHHFWREIWLKKIS